VSKIAVTGGSGKPGRVVLHDLRGRHPVPARRVLGYRAEFSWRELF
jgi:hypothetical protein